MSLTPTIYLLSLLFLINIKEKYLEAAKNFMYIIFIILLPAIVNNTKLNYEIGNDIYVYREFFLSHSMNSSRYHGDLLFDFVTKVLSVLKVNVFFYFLLISFLQVYLVYKFIKKYSINWKFSFFLYTMLFYYSLNFNILRQGIALSFSLLFIDSILERKKNKSLLVFVIMILIHKSSMVLSIVFFLPLLKKVSLNYSKIFMACIISILAGEKLNVFFIKVLRSIVPNQYKGYFNANNFFTSYRVTIFYVFYLLFIGVLVLLFIKISKKYNLSMYDLIFVKLNYVGYILLLILFSMVIFRRFLDYFLVYIIVNVPNLYSKSRFSKLLYFFVFVFVSFRFLIS